MNTCVIIIIFTIMILLIFMKKINPAKESFKQVHFPEIYEGRVRDMFIKNYLHDLTLKNKKCVSSLGNCSKMLTTYNQMGGKCGTYKNCCEKCMSSLKNQENNTKIYYQKFRQLQDQLAIAQTKLVNTEKALDYYKTKLIFCKRKLTKQPIVAKCHGNRRLVPNTITGLGVETQYKQQGSY